MSLESLYAEANRLEAQLVEIRGKIQVAKKRDDDSSPAGTKSWEGTGHTMSKDEVERYSRQILLHSFGSQAQDKLCKGSVLVIGAGGLGCPAAIYLAAAGVGKIGIVDKDVVELSNLHRQILHTEAKVGQHKADSAAKACRAVNSLIQVVEHRDGFHPRNALELVKEYDVVLDASDNAPTRYLISDACCVLGKPLVSGAAIGTDGQLNVYCYKQGPCYRCLFPVPPAAGNCARCSDAGVLGPVPGLIGVLQALEAIKLISGVGTVSSQKMLMVDTLSGRFTSVKLRGRQPSCAACGESPSITADNLAEYNYKDFTGQDYNDSAPESIRLLAGHQRLTAQQLPRPDEGTILLDVRPKLQYDAAHIPGVIHIPFDEDNPLRFEKDVTKLAKESTSPMLVMCRRGNNSQRAVDLLDKRFGVQAKDLVGGMQAWADFDTTFPVV